MTVDPYRKKMEAMIAKRDTQIKRLLEQLQVDYEFMVHNGQVMAMLRAKVERIQAIPGPAKARLVAQLQDWGRECCGGSGDETNPQTGQRYGEVYFATAEALASAGAGESAGREG